MVTTCSDVSVIADSILLLLLSLEEVFFGALDFVLLRFCACLNDNDYNDNINDSNNIT